MNKSSWLDGHGNRQTYMYKLQVLGSNLAKIRRIRKYIFLIYLFNFDSQVSQILERSEYQMSDPWAVW